MTEAIPSYCIHCGAQMQADARFCPECGQPAAEAGPRPASLVYASYGSRVAAWVIDILIVLAAFIAVALAFRVAAGSPPRSGESGQGPEILLIPFLPLYGALCHRYWHGQTIGKRAFGIAVEDVDGGPISLGQALGRAYLRAVMFAVVYIPWIVDSLWPLWQPENRSLHDLAASTVVVQRGRAAPFT